MVHCIDQWMSADYEKSLWRTTVVGAHPQASIIRILSDFASGQHTYGQSRKPLEDWLKDEHREERTACIFTSVVHVTRSHFSKDARDKVFGLLGVVRKAARIRNLPDCPTKADYSKPVAQVYEEATLYILQNVSDLLPLSMVSERSRVKVPDLQSWVIDFSVQGQGSIGMLNADFPVLETLALPSAPWGPYLRSWKGPLTARSRPGRY